jgi:site-specific recombinase XerD
MGGPTPTEITETIIHRLSESGWARESVDIYAEHLRNFAGFLERGLDVMDMAQVEKAEADRFVNAVRADGSRPSDSIRHYRRSAIRALYKPGRAMGVLAGDPTLDIVLPPREPDWARALVDAEIAAARSAAVNSITNSRRAVAWSLAEATAQTAEIAVARLGDLDLGRNRVWLQGGPRNRARWGFFTEWGRAQIEWRLRTLDRPGPEVPLVAWRRPPRNPRFAASCIIRAVLDRAGLHAPDVHPRSVPAWRAKTEFDAGARIEQVAVMLGFASLDRTARVLGLDPEQGWAR